MPQPVTHCKWCGVRRDTWVPPYNGFCRAGPACPAGSAVRNRRADRGVRPYGSVTRSAAKRAVGDAGPYESVTRGAVRGRNPPVTTSPCQPPLGKGAQGTGMRIATGALRPRNDRSRKNLRVIPRPVRRLVVGIRNTSAQRSRRTDCHSQCAHWLRNDKVTRGAVRRADVGIGPYG